MKNTEETVPCRICGEPTPMTGTQLCDNCWEIEARLKSPRLKPEACAYFLRMLATPKLFKAIDEADAAFAVVNICDDLTPQARSCLKKAWPLIQDARILLKPNGIYEAAVKEARAEESKEAPELTKEDWVEIYYALRRQHDTLLDDEKRWKAHLREIMEKIGPDGENMAQEEEWTMLKVLEIPKGDNAIEVKGRNGYFKLAQVDILVQDGGFILFFSSAKSGKNSPMTIRGTKEDVTRLLNSLLHIVQGGTHA